MSKNKEEKQISFYYILGKIGDILLWPVIIIALISSFFMLVQKSQNKVTSVFGYSFVNVLSGSMINEGFKIGDTVITKRINERDVQLGDIIAFYYSYSTVSTSSVQMVVEYNYSSGKEVDYSESNINYGVDVSQIPKLNDKSAEYLEKAQKDKYKVYFHRVIGIYVDEDGNLFFKTKGSNNSSADSPLSRGDLVVGKYVNTPIFVRRAVSFCASSIGMIILVCVPLSLLVLMQCLSLIEQISIISLEKKLMAGELSYTDEEIKKELHSDQIEIYNKAYYYYMTPKEQRQEVKQFLWSDVLNKKVPSKKEQLELITLNNATAKLEESESAYWDEWIDNTTGGNKKHMIAYKNKIFIDKLLNDQKTEVKGELKNEVISDKKIVDENLGHNKDNIKEMVESKSSLSKNPQKKVKKTPNSKIEKANDSKTKKSIPQKKD